MTVLGIDPGLANTGYGVVTRRGGRLLALDGGMIETPAAMPVQRRLAAIHARVEELLREHDCHTLALEQIYFGQNVHSAFAVGQARGVCVLAAGQRDAGCASYTPQQIKAAVCGHGGAAKDQVARMVRSLLALPSMPAPDHVSDAFAVAICHLNSTPLADAVRAASASGAATARHGSLRGAAGAGAHRPAQRGARPARGRGGIATSSKDRKGGGG